MTFSWGRWSFDREKWVLADDGAEVALPPRAMRLLAVLLERAPNVVTKDQLLTDVWNDAHVEEGTIAYHVNLLRKTLDDSTESCIQTARTLGYRFALPLTIIPTHSSQSDAPATSSVQAAAVPITVGRRIPWRLAVGLLLGAAAITAAWQPWARGDMRVAVMPFQVAGELSATPEAGAQFAAAVAAALTALGIQGVPPSAFARDENAFAAAADARAELLITGTVHDTGGVRTVVAALFRVNERKPLWTSTFERPLHGDGGSDELPEAIAVESYHRLAASGVTQSVDATTPSREAHDRHVQASEQWKLRTPHSIQRAIQLYEEALALDPQFARAYAGLANCYNLIVSGLAAPERYTRALQYASMALTLAPDSAEAETSMAFLRYKFERRWADADAGFRRAIALDPKYALARHWYGEFLSLMGRTAEGLAQLETAQSLSPRDMAIKNDLIGVLIAAGQLERADAVLAEALRIEANWFFTAGRQSQILMARGQTDDAMEAHWRMLLLRGVPVSDVDVLREGYRAGGLDGFRRANVALLLRKAVEPSSPSFFGNATTLSRDYALLCQADEAIHWFEIALNTLEDAPLVLLQGDYDCLAGNVRFERIVEKLGLREAWDRRQAAQLLRNASTARTRR